jgi:hypothetical protein
VAIDGIAWLRGVCVVAGPSNYWSDLKLPLWGRQLPPQ